MISAERMLTFNNIAITLLDGVAFGFYFSMMLRLFDCIVQPIAKRWARIASGVLVYVFLIVITLLQFPLYVNWTLVAVLYVIEIRILYRASFRVAICMGTQGALLSLALNAIARTLMALLIDQPLAVFDSRVDVHIHNLKWMPIGIAFLAAGALLWTIRKLFIDAEAVKDLFGLSHRRMIVAMSISFFAYLDLNLFIYATGGNEPIIKLWCLKSALCVLFGDLLYLSHVYTIAQYLDYAKKSSHTRQELETGRQSNAALENAASRDALTGCKSRTAGLHMLETLFAQENDFLLCYLDLNDLKGVNDRLGHNAGDQYIAAVSHALCAAMKTDAIVCRYGGDEFLVLQLDNDVEALRSNMEEVQRVLHTYSNTSQYPFVLSVGYGIAARQEADSVDKLLALGDARMYEDKRGKTPETVS